MRKSTKKPKVQKSTLTIRMAGEECKLIEALKQDTHQKSATKALFEAARFYLNDRVYQSERIEDLESNSQKVYEKLEKYEELFCLFRELSAIKK